MSSKLWAYILLIAFGVLLAPRNLVHDCEHDDDHIEWSQDHAKFEKKCFACDYDMDAALRPTTFKLSVIPPDYYVLQEYAVHLTDVFPVEQDFLRGPPAC